MSLISDKSHEDKLKALHINIKTSYLEDGNIKVRNTNNSYNDDIKKGVRCKKEYYLNDKNVHTEDKFDSRIEYTFISKNMENTNHKCVNCGYTALTKEFENGCPYCRTKYNIDYTDKDLGSKYHYDRVLRSTKYRIITAIIDLIISTIISFIFIKTTSRTFNSYDISKIFIYGLILSVILYYFFYLLDAKIILGPIKRYKDNENLKQIKFWEETGIDKKTFYNNLNYEVRNMYYSKDNIIDFDVIDYDEFNYTKDDTLHVTVKAYVRIVYFKNNKIISKYSVDTYKLKECKENTLELKEGTNLIKCPSCGSSTDATKEACTYCRNKIPSIRKWIIEKQLKNSK